MHKKTALFSTLVVLLASLVFAPKAHAIWMEQHQSSTNDFSGDCNGTCHVSNSSSMSQDQGLSTTNNQNWNGGMGMGNGDWWNAPSTTSDTSGQATVSWPFRGGTCTIYYTESSARVYHYSTSTACDNGQLTIGGLVPGRSYRFQVKSDAGRWTRPVRMIAR